GIGIDQKRRAVVTAPCVIGGMVVKNDVGTVYAGFNQLCCGERLRRRIGNIDAYLFTDGYFFDEFAVRTIYRIQFTGPTGLFMGPTEPGGPMRVPFGREKISGCLR